MQIDRFSTATPVKPALLFSSVTKHRLSEVAENARGVRTEPENHRTSEVKKRCSLLETKLSRKCTVSLQGKPTRASTATGTIIKRGLPRLCLYPRSAK